MPKLPDPLGGRAIEEWIGKTPDSAVPEKVKARVFLRYGGRCYLTKMKIDNKPWQVEHRQSLALGGENREGNLAPALVEPHKAKTKVERGVRAKADRILEKRLGLGKSKQKIPSRPFPGKGQRKFGQ